MNSRERIDHAMHHRIPDRVPVMCQLALGHYFLNTDIAPHEIWFTSEGYAQAAVALQRRYRFDGILINLPGRPADLLSQVASIEKTDEGERLTWKNGFVTFHPWDDNPYYTPPDPTRPQRADFATIDPQDLSGIDDLPGYVWNTYHVPWLDGKETGGPLTQVPDYFLRTIDQVRSLVGDEVSVHGEVFSPFTHFMELFGYENALMNLVMDAEKSHALLDRLTEGSVTWARAQARHGVDAVLISSAFAGAPFASRRIYREFVVPYERRVTDAIRAEGVAVYTHSCGSIGDRLDLMVETGTMGIDTLDPPPLGDGDLAVAKRDFGDKLFIKGNLNAVALLAMKTKEEVISYVSEVLRTGMSGGGYILSTSCSVSPKMEPWKLELLAPLAEEIGRYGE
ncbi:MAG: uroporphyrinogen decarboxylase family protein [Anaerolineae bacterium]|jgi:hypothetical protein